MGDTSGHRRDNSLHVRIMESRRWSSPQLATPWNLYSHYVDGVNENEHVLRMHRKRMVKTADSKSRAQRRGTYKATARRTSSAQQILKKIHDDDDDFFYDWTCVHPQEWSKEKFRDRLRKRQKMLKEAASAEEQGSPNTTLSRKVTSRMSDRKKSRESMALVNNQDNLSSSDQEEEKEEKAVTIRTFWWYCRVVKAICKLCLDMQKLSMRKTQQTTLSELYYVSISGTRAPEDEDKEGQILYFDKTLFARKRACSHVPEWAQSIMITRPELRRPEDILRLKHLLMGMRSFREKFNEQMRTKICQVVRYTRCDKGRVILRQGHYGQDFYFIFSGSVFIQIDLVDQRTGDRIPSTENIIRSGESFGELALLGDGLRSASVICREPTELCQIDKTTFLKICPALFNEQLQEKIEFAK
ncbi:hypothetical protein C0Q70_05205 [Pomacea canaliculata]|uniref:Cyclic nucleotide-binding domain-containing protein n=1 Tax=Pomacea canaliculata TaxID=400727 RepID=A0A2T7PKJ1_POMCA|nr:hypothetical protein C0Q70_05205 [Pomacea canaliculata]